MRTKSVTGGRRDDILSNVYVYTTTLLNILYKHFKLFNKFNFGVEGGGGEHHSKTPPPPPFKYLEKNGMDVREKCEIKLYTLTPTWNVASSRDIITSVMMTCQPQSVVLVPVGI